MVAALFLVTAGYGMTKGGQADGWTDGAERRSVLNWENWLCMQSRHKQNSLARNTGVIAIPFPEPLPAR